MRGPMEVGIIKDPEDDVRHDEDPIKRRLR